MSLAIYCEPVGEGFSARLKALREARGMTQRELAARAGLDPGHIGLMETRPGHDPRSKTRARLAAALGVDPSELDGTPTERNWQAEFMSDPKYSLEFKRSVILLAEQEERRLLQRKRKKKSVE